MNKTKHGGHERVIDQQAYLRAPENCTLEDDPNWIRLKSGRKEFLYPKPANFVLNDKGSFQKGEVVGAAYHTTSPIYSLNALISLMRASGGEGVKYFEKDTPFISECYAYDSGKIHYEITPGTDEVRVFIGSREYSYNDKVIYYYPEGTMINKYQRFCSGIANMDIITRELSNNAEEMYYYFRMQFYELTSGKYASKGIVDDGDVREELTEMLFLGLIRLNTTKMTADYLGTQRGAKESGSFYTLLSYGYAGQVVKNALKGEAELKPDVMTNTVLGVLLNNTLDDDLNYR